MAVSELEKLIMAIKELDYETLVDLACKNRAKKNPFSFYGAFKKRKESEMTKTIGELVKMLLSCMEKYLGNTGNTNWASLDNESCTELGKIIQAAVDIATVSFQLEYTPSGNLLQMAILLNGIILELPSTLDSLKNNIAHLCEKMACANFVDKSQYFLFNVLIYLLRRTLQNKPLKSDVKRVYNMRKTIQHIIEMSEADTVELWVLFKKCVVSNFYLSMVEGQKIIALILTLDIDLVVVLHDIIRERLPVITVRVASAYGRAYFEAWTHSIRSDNAALKNAIEITCLQDFILLAIRDHKKPLIPTVRKVLAQFHLHKKEFEVTKMLYFLYQPLLWRYLKNPDGQMRANASQLFLDIFPLEDPDVKVVTTDLELNDQLLMIRDLLVDEFPVVRVTTIIGLCIQMSVNWEIFPEEILKTYFRILLNELSCDSSSAEVRCAVAKGCKVLLENPLTISTLQNILPKMQGLFHDISENVRIAFCQLLLKVKTISAIKYYHIVPLEHLLARMEEDCHAVRKSIANLIHNSYFPKREDPKIWLGRCLQIMKKETSTAARVFFTYVSSFIGVENAVKFMIQAIRAVHFYVRTQKRSTRICSFVEPNNKENVVSVKSVVSLEEAVGFNNVHVVQSLIDCIAIMWLSLKIDVDKPENKCHLKMLVAKVGRPLAELCLHYKNSSVWESIFYISSFLPVSVVPSLASLCFLRLKNLAPDTKPKDYTVVLECLCNQYQGFELLQLIKEWIEVGLDDAYVPPPPKKRKRIGKNGEGAYYNVPKPYLANEMWDAMLSHRGLQRAILKHKTILTEMLCFVDYAKTKIEKSTAKSLNEKEAAFLQLLLFNILRQAVFLHDERDESCSVQVLDDIVKWTNKKLLKHLKVTKKTNIYYELVGSICKDLCTVISDVAGLGFMDITCTLYLEFIGNVLHSACGSRYAVISVRFLYKYAMSAQYLYVHRNEPIMLNNVAECLPKILKPFHSESFLESIPASDLKDVELVLANVMQIVVSHISLLHVTSNDAVTLFMKIIIDSACEKTNHVVTELIDQPFANIKIPTTGTFFLNIMLQKPKLITNYLIYFQEYFMDAKKDIALWLSIWLIVFNVLCQKSPAKSILRETLNLINALDDTLQVIYPRNQPDDRSDDVSKEPKPEKSPELQVFEKHCYSEFVKLKKLQYTRIQAARRSV